MDASQELIADLRAGERIRLVLTPNEPVGNAVALFETLEREHGLKIGRTPHVVNGVISFVIWAENVPQRTVRHELPR